MNEPRRGYIQIPRAALDAATSHHEATAILDLYRRSDRSRGDPFDASLRFLSQSWRVSMGSTRRIVSKLEAAGILRLIAADTGHPRGIQMLSAEQSAKAHPRTVSQAHPRTVSPTLVEAHLNEPTAPPNPKAKTVLQAHPEALLQAHPEALDEAQSIRVNTRDLLEPLEQLETTPLEAPQGASPPKPNKVLDLWEQLNTMRSEYRPDAAGLSLTANRRRVLKARLKDYSADEILSAYRWWWTDTSDIQAGLREAHDLDTFIRPSRHDRYQTEAANLRDRIASGQPAHEPSTRRSDHDWEMPEDCKPLTAAQIDLERRACNAYRDSIDSSRRALADEMRDNGRTGRIHFNSIERYEREKYGIVNGGTLPSVAAAERAKDDIINPCPF